MNKNLDLLYVFKLLMQIKSTQLLFNLSVADKHYVEIFKSTSSYV